MKPLRCPRPLFAARIHVAAALLSLAPSLPAADRFWIDPGGGPFSDVANWSATDGGAGGASVPGATDVANFNLSGTYMVSFNSGATTTALDVDNGNVTFNLNGFTYLATSGLGIDVGNVAGQTGRLTVQNGTLNLNTTGDNVTIGVATGQTGFLTVGAGGRLGDGVTRPDVFVGLGGTGTLTVSDNGLVEGQVLRVGDGPLAAGTVSISGPTAAANFAGSAVFGSSCDGVVSVFNGGSLATGSTVLLGQTGEGSGSVSVSGAGSQWLMASGATLGDFGAGALTLSSGGLVTSTSVTLGNGATSSGVATVSGANTLWTVNSAMVVGLSGVGSVALASGARIMAATVTLGSNASGEGRVTVSGAGTLWEATTALTVGSNGSGSLLVSSGGEMSTTNLGIGTLASGTGVVTVTGAGSVVRASGTVTLGSLGDGTVNVLDGAELYAASMTVADPTGTPVGRLTIDGGAVLLTGDLQNGGVFSFPNGLLGVSGLFQPSAAAASFTLNGVTNSDLPTLDLTGAGASANITSLTVGSTRRGQLNLREGRVLNLGANAVNLGSLAGGSGIVNVQSGARLTTTGALTIGGNGASAGGTGVLNVAGGTVDAGTLRLHSGGTLQLGGGLLAVDSLPVLNGAFHWTSGELRIDAATTVIDDFIAGKLLGPAKTLGAGQTLTTPLLGGQLVEISTGLTVDGGIIQSAALSNLGTLELRAGRVGGSSTTTNSGLVQLGGPLAQFGGGGSLTNHGTLRGSGQLVGSLSNGVTGRIDVIAGERLVLNTTTGSTNAGLIAVSGGELQVNSPLVNAASTGLIAASGAILRFNGVTNNGSLVLATGVTDVFGDLTNNVGGRITISGGAMGIFYDDIVNNGGINVSAAGSLASAAVFFGRLSGNGVAGAGHVFIEGDARPGASPGVMAFGGDLSLGPFARTVIEIAGTSPGTHYDRLTVAATLNLGGQLEVQFINGFVPGAGQSFDILDAAATTGSFSGMTLPALPAGLFWRTDSFQTQSVLQVGVVPATFAEFAAAYGLTEGPAGDDDDDQRSNLLEFLLGTNPSDPASVPVQTFTRNGLQSFYSFLLPEFPAPAGRYVIEASPDLQTWTRLATKTGLADWIGGVVVAPPVNGFVTVTFSEADAAPRRFYRLRAGLE